MLMGSYALICAEIHLAVRTGNAYDWLDDVKEAFETRENFLFFCEGALEFGFSAGKKRVPSYARAVLEGLYGFKASVPASMPLQLTGTEQGLKLKKAVILLEN